MTSYLDDVLAKISLCDRYYVTTLTLIFIANLSNIVYSENYVFITEEIGYTCKDKRFTNNTCGFISNSSDVCTEWVYDKQHTFVADFQLACQEWKRVLVGSVASFGYMIGLLVVGPLSDRVGRKKMIVITGVLGGVFGLARSFVPWYWGFIILQFLEGALGDTSSPTFMLTMEIVSKEKRVLAQQICDLGFTTGSVVLALSAWSIPNWKHMLRVIYAPAVLFILYNYLMDESPRWLLTKGKNAKAAAIIEKASRNSKVKVDKDVFDNIISNESEKELSLVKLLRATFSSNTLLARFFICLVWWTTSTFVSLGMKVNSVYLQGNSYVNFALNAIVTIPGNLMITLLLNRYSRKTVLIGSFLLSAVFLLIQPFVPSNIPWLSILLFLIGNLLSSMYFGVTYLFTSEIFPTYTRNSMHALCSSLGRVGSIVAVQTPLLIKYWPGLPSIVFGLASLVAGLITLMAPNTAHVALPDTVCQAEAYGLERIKNIEETTSHAHSILS